MYSQFVNKVISWYEMHKRDLPWRKTKDPYLIWLSEIILQQTRVAQGLPYYMNFSEKYPTVNDFANASIDEILRTWQGLGYYSRARNMYYTAQEVRDQYNGVFPSSYSELIKLKGIGAYTASAISSFVSNEKQAVVDGNVYRVISRYLGIEEPINSGKGPKVYGEIANQIISHTKHHGTYNQAIMEFGALQCKPSSPNCKECPLESSCLALSQNKVELLPIKLKKLKIIEREINYLVITDGLSVFMKRRGDGDIWNGLYDFPEIKSMAECSQMTKFPKSYIHKLTHQKLSISFWITDGFDTGKVSDQGAFYTYEACENLPKPIIIKQFLDEWSKTRV